MRKTINIATMPSRVNELRKTIRSLEHQFDEIRIYLNGFDRVPDFLKKHTTAQGEDLTDNGKFYFLSKITEPEYYFSADDDIIYPLTYAKDMIEAIEKYQTIVTHHGRALIGLDVSYYRGHHFFHCANFVEGDYVIDVPGTGVTAFDTRYFKPDQIWKSEDHCMSDVLFGLEAKKSGKSVTILAHKAGYILPLVVEDSIWQKHSRKEHRQIELANEIYKLKKYFD